MKTSLTVKYLMQGDQEEYPNGNEAFHQSGILLYGTFALNTTHMNCAVLWLIVQHAATEMVTFAGSPQLFFVYEV